MALKQYDLNDYANELKTLGLLAGEHLLDVKETTVTGLEFNSKKVEPGTLFICKGAHFKKEFLNEAIARGAIGYVAEEEYDIDEDVPYLLVSDIRKAMAPMAETFYNYPQEHLTIIGVGGTKGKTTTAYYLKTILDKYLEAENKPLAGMISSIMNYDGLKEEESKNTTPEALDLQRHLAHAVEAGLEYMVMEVSSQALKYHRTAGLTFAASIFLNIDEDHISPVEHPNFADYLKSKAMMFGQTKDLIINRETQEADYLLMRAKEANDYHTFSLISEEADYYAADIDTVDLTSQFSVKGGGIDADYTLAMPGEFNIENALSAIAAINLLGIPQKYAKEALKSAQVPGRMGIYSTADKNIIAIADYAHNRLSFEQLALSMRKAYPDYQIVSVFGAPGGKALGRREELGSVGGKYSDYVYITEDDPEFEDVSDISEEISEYVAKENTPYEIVIDRETAITTAFEEASEQTVILVIGKGHEAFMKVDGKRKPIKADSEVIQELIQAYDSKS